MTYKLTQLSPRSHPRHLVEKRTAQRDVIKDIISDSQVNSYFRYRWSPASLTIKIYTYLFLYLYITSIMINKSKITKEPKQTSRLGTASNENSGRGGGLQLVCSRTTRALSSALVPQTVVRFAWKIPNS